MNLPTLPSPAMVHVDAQGYSTPCYTCEQMQEYAIAALRAQPSGWMPIESAPKDMSPVLLQFPELGGWAVGPWRGSWSPILSEWVVHLPFLIDGKAATASGLPQPTAWQPLSPPPGQQPDHSELVKDAARYRWLREQHWSSSKFAVVSNPKTAVNVGSICPSRELLDETIDHAIAEAALDKMREISEELKLP